MRNASWRVFALGAALGASSLAALRDLPALPELKMAGFLPAIRKQVEPAYDDARSHPNEPEANGKLGMLLDSYEQYAEAAACYQRAHRLAPESFRWIYYLGTVEKLQGEYEQATVTFADALKLRPDYVPARLNLADSLLAAGSWAESEKIYRAILEAHPNIAAAQYGLGRSLAARGETRAAAQAFEKACELFPRYGAAHYALALAYRKLRDPGKAEKHFALYNADKTTRPLVEDPLRAEVHALNISPTNIIRRAAEMENAGDLDAAIREHERALEIDPSNVQANINLIILYGRLGQMDKAEQHFKAAQALNPHRADAYYNYGVLLVGARRYAEAEQAFRRAIEINPFNAEAHHNLGVLLEQQGRLEEAAGEYGQALRDRPDYRLAHFHLARILANRGKYTEAIQHLLKTLTPEDENTPGYLYALGAAYARAGDRQNALVYIRRAREEAAARGQTQLLSSIDRDLRALEP